MSCLKTLFDICEVMDSEVFPLLSVNDLLRMRCVCQWTKILVQDYLRVHPRSSRHIRVTTNAQSGPGSGSLEEFLDKDNLSSIPIPTCHLRWENHCLPLEGSLSVGIFEDPLLPTFLERYAKQIVHLHVSTFSVPTRKQEKEIYEQFVNLRVLTATEVYVPTDRSLEDIVFPTTLKNLKRLHITVFEYDEAHELALLWKLFQFCINLEYFHIPKIRLIHGTPERENCRFQHIHEVLKERHHKRLRVFDMWQIGFVRQLTLYSPELWEMSLKYDIKWEGVSLGYLRTLEKIYVEEIAHQILSARVVTRRERLKEDNCVPLPNLVEMYVLLESYRDPAYTKMEMPSVTTVEQIRRSLSPQFFPGLKKVTLRIDNSLMLPISGFERYSVLWSCFLGLKELRLVGDFGDGIFMGTQGAPSFLQLTNLRKLTIDLDYVGDSGLTDTTFCQVLCNMKLREFYIFSRKPIKTFTAVGIKSLVTGSFRETIERFPFNGWALDGVEADEFQELARDFPGNLQIF